MRDQRLYWADIPEKKLHIFNPKDGENQTFDLPDLVTSVSTRKNGGLILTLRSSFAFFDPATGKLDILAEPEPDKPGNRFNDGKCDRQGRLWAGTMGDVDWDSPIGSLYRFDESAKPDPNGGRGLLLQWSRLEPGQQDDVFRRELPLPNSRLRFRR